MKYFKGYFSDDSTIEKSINIDTLDDYKKQALTVFSTENVFERTGGLLKLPPLARQEGLLIYRCNSIHTFGMGYALDLAYLNRDLKVIKVVKNVRPRRMSLCIGAKHTLELLAGEISRLGITQNMTLLFDEKPE
jgi:uncharacterized membrane protein (UPF0127 family)